MWMEGPHRATLKKVRTQGQAGIVESNASEVERVISKNFSLVMNGEALYLCIKPFNLRVTKYFYRC